jgi:hypothetical protein
MDAAAFRFSLEFGFSFGLGFLAALGVYAGAVFVVACLVAWVQKL